MATAIATETEPAGAFVPLSFRVAAKRQDTVDTWTLTLEPEEDGFAVAPGQFVMVYVFGIGEVSISVSGPPEGEGEPLELTVRAVGAVTEAICASEPGALLGLRGPCGNSWPIGEAAGGDVVVVAGGIGLAPLRPVVLQALASRDAYGAVSVLYGARTPGDLLYTDQLDGWRDALAVDVTVDAADTSWKGKVGVVPKLVGNADFRPDAVTAFVCGPEVMIHFTVQVLRDHGVPDERIFLSLERDMRCGIGLCGHCQLGPTLVCRDGPVYSQAQVGALLAVREL
ncbi:MAG TPA: FAD/NAD(P)-binding protein [Gaiellaceae bacterium]|nr:FAD/NAD(P)-binding protein [Gaiellaceae bacterium]